MIDGGRITQTSPHRETNERLPAFAWPGGYQIVYYDGDMSTMCPDCANERDGTGYPGAPAYWEVFWEGPDQFCSYCDKTIPSAYGDPDMGEQDREEAREK